VARDAERGKDEKFAKTIDKDTDAVRKKFPEKL
jgi:hypothetical protein